MRLGKKLRSLVCVFKGHIPVKWERSFARVNGKRKKALPKRVFFTRCQRCCARLFDGDRT